MTKRMVAGVIMIALLVSGGWMYIATADMKAHPKRIVDVTMGPKKGNDLLCQWEPNDPKTQAYLTRLWVVAEDLVAIDRTLPRPKVCGRNGAPVEVFEDGQIGILCGYWDEPTNSIFVANDPFCGPVQCLIVHEFLHGLKGPGHSWMKPYLDKIGCGDSLGDGGD